MRCRVLRHVCGLVAESVSQPGRKHHSGREVGKNSLSGGVPSLKRLANGMPGDRGGCAGRRWRIADRLSRIAESRTAARSRRFRRLVSEPPAGRSVNLNKRHRPPQTLTLDLKRHLRSMDVTAELPRIPPGDRPAVPGDRPLVVQIHRPMIRQRLRSNRHVRCRFRQQPPRAQHFPRLQEQIPVQERMVVDQDREARNLSVVLGQLSVGPGAPVFLRHSTLVSQLPTAPRTPASFRPVTDNGYSPNRSAATHSAGVSRTVSRPPVRRATWHFSVIRYRVTLC